MKAIFSSSIRLLTFILTVVLILYVLPPSVGFKYNYKRGVPWKYQDLYAPFNFAIHKSDQEIQSEQAAIKQRALPYYNYDVAIVKEVSDRLKNFSAQEATQKLGPNALTALVQLGEKVLKEIYKYGVFDSKSVFEDHKLIALKKGNVVEEVQQTKILFLGKLENKVIDLVKDSPLKPTRVALLKSYLLKIIQPNVSYDQAFTEKFLNEQLKKISRTRGNISEGQIIVSKGQTVSPEISKILESLRVEMLSTIQKSAGIFSIIGYTILIVLVLLMMFSYLKNHHFKTHYRHILLLNVSVFFMVFLATSIFRIDLKYLYAVPLCILPLLIKVFFDSHIAIFVHLITVLIIAIAVPDSYEFIYLQMMGGVIAVLSSKDLHKRANLFISIFQITVIYIIAYLSFHLIQEKTFITLDMTILGFILLNGLLTLFAQPLIYLYEKIFRVDSDLSLLELSDTNNTLLRELAHKAQGTFAHSIQVANLAEAAATEIGANALLARVGALYHDIGKMKVPMYFTENQTGIDNPHDNLPPEESARIIIDHVKEGIDLARKYLLPERIVQFIRTHHGNTQVYYFYKKALDASEDGTVDEGLYKYPGPLPFSKETAIVMMCDCVEAASKSLKNPTAEKITEFIDEIIDGLMTQGQFNKSNITFKDIDRIKDVLAHKLISIYNLRIAYPK